MGQGLKFIMLAIKAKRLRIGLGWRAARDLRGDEERENLCRHVLSAMQEAIDCYIDDFLKREADEGGFGIKVVHEVWCRAGDEELAMGVIQEPLGLECCMESWRGAFQGEKNADRRGHFSDTGCNGSKIFEDIERLWPVGCGVGGIFLGGKKVDGQVGFIGAVSEGSAAHMEGLEKLRVSIDHGHGLATSLAKVSERHVADCHIVHRHMVNRGEGMSGSEEVHGGEERGKPGDALAALWVPSGHHEDGPIDLPRLNAERNLVWR